MLTRKQRTVVYGGIIILGTGAAVALLTDGMGLVANSCVAEGCLILRPSGPVPIERIELGDRVDSLSEDGRRCEGVVTAVRKGTSERIISLDLGSGAILDVTPSHWIATTTGWRRAGEIEAGEEVITSRGPSRVLAIT